MTGFSCFKSIFWNKTLVILISAGIITSAAITLNSCGTKKDESKAVKASNSAGEEITPMIIEPPTSVKIKEKYINVSFKTTPSKAKLYINDKYCGITPLDVKLSKEEKIKVVFIKEGYRDYSIKEFLPDEDKNTISTNLEKIVYSPPAETKYTPGAKPASKPRKTSTPPYYKPSPKATPTTF